MDKQGKDFEVLEGKQNKTNILSMDLIKSKHDEEYKQVEAYVTLGDEMLGYKVYEKFPIKLRDEYVLEMMEFAIRCATEEEYIENNFVNQLNLYSLMLLIDKFTDIELPADDAGKIVYASYLLDLGIFNIILDTMDDGEKQNVMDEAEQVINEQNKKIVKDLEAFKLEHADLLADTDGVADIEEFSALQNIKKDTEKLEDN